MGASDDGLPGKVAGDNGSRGADASEAIRATSRPAAGTPVGWSRAAAAASFFAF